MIVHQHLGTHVACPLPDVELEWAGTTAEEVEVAVDLWGAGLLTLLYTDHEV